MQHRRLGRTGIEVSEIGFGAWGIGGAMWQGAEDTESLRALHTAVDEGVNVIDTALVYGSGHSEKLVGQVVRERSERIYVFSKIPPKNMSWPSHGTLEKAFPSHHIVNCVNQSLANLKLEQLDLIQFHVWDESWLSREEWFETLQDLKRQGKFAYFGVSIDDHRPASAVELVRSGKVDAVQVIYNIFDQSPEDELFPACRQYDVGVIARVPFDEGSLTGTITPETTFPPGDWREHYFSGDRKREVFERARELEKLLGSEVETLPELALRFCLHHPAISTVIPGMRKTEHVRSNVAASDRPALSARMISELRKHRWVRNFYPEN
jgi:aryl-alcohol dehydrogenase-like predicted oxidoreductase